MKTNFARYKKKILSTKEFILNKDVNIRLILILSLKKITWKEELITKFDIQPKDITNFFEKLKTLGLILFKPLCEVDDILFETVIKQNPCSFYDKRDKTMVYTFNPSHQEEIVDIMTDVFKLTNTRSDLRILLSDINTKTQNHRESMQKIYEEESSLHERYITYPDGFFELKETMKKKKFIQELLFHSMEFKQDLLEQKQEKNLLSNKESNQLAILQEKGALVVANEEKTNFSKQSTTYTGIYSNLTSQELETIIEGIGDKEEKKIEKQYEKQVKENIKELNKKVLLGNGGKFIGKGYHGESVQDTFKTEEEVFLDSLLKNGVIN